MPWLIYVQKVKRIKSDLKKEGGILREKTKFVTLIQNQQHLRMYIRTYKLLNTETEQTKLYDKMDAEFQKSNYYTMGRTVG